MTAETTESLLNALNDKLQALTQAHEAKMQEVFKAEMEIIRNTPGMNMEMVTDIVNAVKRYPNTSLERAYQGAMADYIWS